MASPLLSSTLTLSVLIEEHCVALRVSFVHFPSLLSEGTSGTSGLRRTEENFLPYESYAAFRHINFTTNANSCSSLFDFVPC